MGCIRVEFSRSQVPAALINFDCRCRCHCYCLRSTWRESPPPGPAVAAAVPEAGPGRSETAAGETERAGSRKQENP